MLDEIVPTLLGKSVRSCEERLELTHGSAAVFMLFAYLLILRLYQARGSSTETSMYYILIITNWKLVSDVCDLFPSSRVECRD